MKKRAFTLIEVITVIAILSIISSITCIGINNYYELNNKLNDIIKYIIFLSNYITLTSFEIKLNNTAFQWITEIKKIFIKFNNIKLSKDVQKVYDQKKKNFQILIIFFFFFYFFENEKELFFTCSANDIT